jgi:hypothetical protein
MMNKYQLLGGISIAILALAMALSVIVLTGRHSKKRVYWIAGTVLGLIVVESIICWIIYFEYHA